MRCPSRCVDALGERQVASQRLDLSLQALAVGARRGRASLIVAPFLAGLGERVEVCGDRVLVFRAVGLGVGELLLKSADQRAQRPGDREGGRREQLAQDHRHQHPLCGRQGEQFVALQVVRDVLVEPLLLVRGKEVPGDWNALGEADVFEHLPAQCSVAERCEASAQVEVAQVLVVGSKELVAEGWLVAEYVLVDEADDPEQLHEAVLERRRGQQQLGRRTERVPQRARHLVAGLVDVAQPVRLVDHDEIPRHPSDLLGLVRGEVVGANDDVVVDLERVRRAGLAQPVEGRGFQHRRGHAELLVDLLRPLLP